MMREEVVIQAINISGRSELFHFQVKLPRDTQKIIGVETGLYLQNIPQYQFYAAQVLSNEIRRNSLIGTLQLKANGKPDIFYSKEIFEKDINIGAGEIKIYPEQIKQERKAEPLKIFVPPDGNSFADFNFWTHGTRREEDTLNICNPAVINGKFKDAIGETLQMDIQYKAMLYIWTERQTKGNDN